MLLERLKQIKWLEIFIFFLMNIVNVPGLPIDWLSAARICRGVSCAWGLKSLFLCPVSAGMNAQQTGCVLAMVYPAHANGPALQSSCPFLLSWGFFSHKNLRFLLTKIQLDRNTLDKTKIWKTCIKTLCLLYIMFQNIKDSTGTGVHGTHGGVLSFGFFVVFCYFFCWNLLWVKWIKQPWVTAVYALNL